MNRHSVSLTVNGAERSGEVEPRRRLADFLREDLGLTGTHVSCEQGVCGACTVLVDGLPTLSCLMLAVQADGAAVETVEGLATGATLHPIQEAFWENHGLQCGFCTPGFLMVLKALFRDRPDASDDEVRHALDSVLCRCTGYQHILAAALAARGKLQQRKT